MQRPQLINFCLEPFVQKVETSTICADGYSASNLTSTNTDLRSRGFRVEHFIRPPVQLEFHFRLPINAACIIVQPDIITDAEAKVEVYGSQFIVSEARNQPQYKLCGNTTIRAMRGQSPALVLRSKAFEKEYNAVEVSPEVFAVLGSYQRSILSNMHLIEQPLKHPNVLQMLKYLKIVVTYCSGPRPMAIRSLEVWGLPSRVCGRADREAAEKAIHNLHVCPPFPSPSSCVRLYGSHSKHEGITPEVDLPTHIHGLNELLHQTAPSKGHCSYSSAQGNDFSAHVSSSKYADENPLLMSTRGKLHDQTLESSSRMKAHLSSAKQGPLMGSLKGYSGQLGMEENMHLVGSMVCKLNQSDCRKNPVKSRLPGGMKDALPVTKREGSVGATVHFELQETDPEDPAGTSAGTFILTTGSVSRLPVPSPVSDREAPCKEWEALLSQTPLESAHPCKSCQPHIPDKFLDEITFEVMLIPMLLPSGHCVDRSTLDKLMHTDSTYGRTPCDPFTGVPFTDASKPEFCAGLKSQIDHYSMQGLPTDSGRSVGSSADIARHLKTSEKGERTKRKWIMTQPVACDQSEWSPEDKRLRLDGGRLLHDRKYHIEKDLGKSPSEHTASLEGKHSTTSMETTERKSDHAHETAVADSLDQALQNLFSAQ